MVNTRSGKRKASRTPSPGSGRSPEPYAARVIRDFDGRNDVEYENEQEEQREAIKEDAERVEQSFLTAVHRRQALPPENERPRVLPVNEAERTARRDALRDIIALPHASDNSNLNRLLGQARWDVQRAAARFRREEQYARLSDPTAPLFPDLPPRQPTRLGVNQNRGHGRASVPESRRAALAALFINMQQAGAPTTENNHTLARFLRHHRWDFRAALRDYLDSNGTNRNLTAYRSTRNLRSTNATQYQQDERLAELLNLVSTDSIYSARELLRRFNFDVSRAYDEYVRLGRVPFMRPSQARGKKRSEPNEGMREVSVEYGPDNVGFDVHTWAQGTTGADGYIEETVSDRSVMDPSPHFKFTSGAQPSNVAKPLDYGDKDAQQKFVIDQVPRGYLPMVNCPNPTFLRIESISKGKYKSAWKTPGTKSTKGTEPLRWSDNPKAPEAKLRSFDWRVSSDIQKLTKIVSQDAHRRGMKVREKPETWHDLEKEFLWREFAAEVEEVAGRLGRSIRRDDLPIRLSEPVKTRIATDMNTKFEGKRVVDGVDMRVIRPHRTSKSINTARGRIQEIVDDFNVPGWPPRPPRARSSDGSISDSGAPLPEDFDDHSIGHEGDDEEQLERGDEPTQSAGRTEPEPDDGMTRRVASRPSYVLYTDKATQTASPESPHSSDEDSP